MSVPKKEQIEELKAYVEGVLHGIVVMEQMGNCRICGKYEDLRRGVCFDCAVPACIRESCPFKRLVFCGQGRKQIWVDSVYTGLKGKRYCDRNKGVCSDQEYVVALENVKPKSEGKK